MRDGDLSADFLEAEAKAIEKRKRRLADAGHDIAKASPLDLAMAEVSHPGLHKDGYDYTGELAAEIESRLKPKH